MKRLNLLLGLIILFSSIHLTAQKRLTNREIYNFEVGDVIHTREYVSFENPETFVKRQILSKSLSPDEDTVYFEVLDSIYSLSPIAAWELSIDYHTISFHSLDSFPKPNDQDSVFNYDSGFSFNQSMDTNTGLITNEYYFNGGDFFFNSFHLNIVETFGLYYSYVIEYKEKVNTLLYFKRGAIQFGKPIRDLLKERRMTKREIFNFDPGDVIHKESSNSAGPPVYTKTNILSKTVSENQDTFAYQIVDSVYNLKNPGPDYYWELSVNQRTITYYQLDSFPVINKDICSFYGHFDSNTGVYLNTYDLHLSKDEFTKRHEYFEGVGRNSYNAGWSRGGHYGGRSEVIYYKKGDKEYGNRIGQLIEDDIDTTQDNNQDIEVEFQVFPNPVSDILYISGADWGWYLIRDVLGRTVLSGREYENGITVLSLSPGVYSIYIRSYGQDFHSKFIKR